MRVHFAPFLISALLLLGSCAQHSDFLDGTLAVEPIMLEASAVQAAAPPTNGNSGPGEVQGLIAYYRGSAPTRLVVFCHGYGHTVEKSWKHHMVRTARPDTVVVTTNYRDNLRFPVLRGAHDTITATQLALERFPSIETVYLFGVSLGGAVSGTALTESAYATLDGSLLYDYYIAVEAVTNLTETYEEAVLFAPQGNQTAITAVGDIEDETGGTPADSPGEYNRRSSLTRVAEFGPNAVGGGIRAIAVVHALNDGTVPYNQGSQLADATVGEGIPTHFYTIGRHHPDQSPGTQGTSGNGFAGHGSERDENHPVIRTAFQQLEDMLDGNYDEATPSRECQVDDQPDGSITEVCTPAK